MFKVITGDKTKKFDKRVDAVMEAMLSYHKDKSKKLVEVLDDNDEVIFSMDAKNDEPTEEQIENAIESVIRGELSNLFTTIDSYNSDLITLQSEGASEESINTIKTILDDLNTHVGMLESLLQE